MSENNPSNKESSEWNIVNSSRPTSKKAKKIAKALEKSFNYLLGGAKSTRKDPIELGPRTDQDENKQD